MQGANIVFLILGVILGGAAGWLLVRVREQELVTLRETSATKETELANQTDTLNLARIEVAGLEAQLEAAQNVAKMRLEDEKRVEDSFAALSRTALAQANTEFLKLAGKTFEKEQEEAKGQLDLKHQAFANIVQPVEETLAALNDRVLKLDEDKNRLANEARNLANALKQSSTRGRWGEAQLKRVAELAGMFERCDFFLQETLLTDEQRRRRPDMLVNLPRERFVVVDSKAVMDAYVTACDTEDSAQFDELMVRHAKHVRDKIDELAKTDYATVLERQDKAVADMVVCYIPGENFFSAAIAKDPFLLEYAAQKRVFLASPTIMITLLRAIELGWRDHELSANAEEIRNLGKALYARLSTMKTHFDTLGNSIESSVKNYNKMVGSLTTMVFPQARRFRDLKAADHGAKELDDGKEIESQINSTSSADWVPPLQIAASEQED